jgi:protein SCO1
MFRVIGSQRKIPREVRRPASRAGLSSLLAASAALLLLMGARPARAETSTASQRPQILRDVGIDQNLNQQIPLDLTFRDETGKTVQLRQYFGSKPVVLSLVYYSCPMLCTMVEDSLLQTLKQISFNVGDQFNVLTISFDPHDTPQMASAKKDVYVGLYGRKEAEQGWHFLTGDQPAITALTKAVGFRYAYDAQSGQYAHATAIMVLTPQGRLARYFYGIQYPPGALRLSLVEASQEKIGSPVDAILLFCCAYNPATGKYGLLVSRLLMIAGGLTVVVLGTMIFMLSRIRKHAPA